MEKFAEVGDRLSEQATVVLIGGPDDRKGQIIELVRSMNLRPVNAGPLAVAPHLERMTLLLLSINKANKVKESGIKITGI